MSQSEFEALYAVGYFNGEEYSNYLSDQKNHEKNFRLRLRLFDKYIDPHKHESLLEIGCAYGFFLNLVKDKFKSVVGVDITNEGVLYAKNQLQLNAHKVDLLQWDFENYKFDIVCMWDVIEHLKSPDLYLKKISENMTSGGILSITTGDIDSVMAKFRGR